MDFTYDSKQFYRWCWNSKWRWTEMFDGTDSHSYKVNIFFNKSNEASIWKKITWIVASLELNIYCALSRKYFQTQTAPRYL